MNVAKKITKEEREEHDIRLLCRALALRGNKVRRENLVRGSGFRAKSGDCVFLGKNTVFVDRRLSSSQQLALVIEYFISTSSKLSPAEYAGLSSPTQREMSRGQELF